MNWFIGRVPAEAVPGDRIVPLHFFENSFLVQGNNMTVSLVFDAVLNPSVLRSSLESLVKREGWQRLGGRPRKNIWPPVTRRWEIEWHVPSEFTPGRTAISFAHIDHGIRASQHPAASRIPSPSPIPAIVGGPDALESLAAEIQAQRDKRLLASDRSVLGLRVNSFTGRTVDAAMARAAFDALGMQYVVEGWSAMLWGQEYKISTPVSLESDPFIALATGWGLGYGVDMLLRAKENRMICVPESYWRPQMEKALGELRKEARSTGEDESKVFLAENDIVTALILRCVVGQMGMSPDRTVTFEGDLIPPSVEHPYVDNAFGWANVLVTAGEVASNPLSWLARRVRKAINEQGTRAQHEAYYEMARTSGAGLPIVIMGDGGMAQVGFSNLANAGLPSYVQEYHGPAKPADGFFILGKDGEGNYWTSACKYASFHRLQQNND
ncbi:hypothetical protein BDW66DRAFT_161145 [Aspergillus desertorum]